MFIGSEGTLGVITDVAILCYPKNAETAVAFLGIAWILDFFCAFVCIEV